MLWNVQYKNQSFVYEFKCFKVMRLNRWCHPKPHNLNILPQQDVKCCSDNCDAQGTPCVTAGRAE